MRLNLLAPVALLAFTWTQPGLAQISFTVPESSWILGEQSFAQKAMDSSSADILVLPVECEEHCFDPIERSLISRLVADRVQFGTRKSVANPSLVIRALGLHRTAYPINEVAPLADLIDATSIVRLRANHDRDGSFSLRITVIDSLSREELRAKQWEDLIYNDLQLPFMSLGDILDEAVEFIADEKPTSTTSTPSFKLDQYDFPNSLEQIKIESAKSTLHSVAHLQFLGMLHPSGEFNEARDQLFLRSLVELQKVGDNQPAKSYFRARALAYLGRRPAAVASLAEPHTVYDKALLAALNGNLLELREHFSAMDSSPFAFMAFRELSLVESRYQDRREYASAEAFVANNPTWAPFLYRALNDTTAWSNYSAATAKAGLEQLLPVETTSLGSWLESAALVVRNPDELDLTRLVLHHIDSISQADINRWLARPQNFLSVSELDIVDLAKSVVVANHVRRVEDDLQIRALPDAALRKISKFSPIFAGHPAVTLQKFRALQALSKDKSRHGDEERSLRRQSAEEGLKGLAWTGQMTADAAWAARGYDGNLIAATSGGPSATGTYELREYPPRYFEWPMDEAWFKKIPRPEIDDWLLDNCINYSWTAFFCLKHKLERAAENSDNEVLTAIPPAYAHRYIGSPGRAEFETQLARGIGPSDAEIIALRSQIDAGSSDSAVYYALGRALKRRGEYQAAQDAFLSNPVLSTNVSGSTLRISSFAGDAGSQFYWIGQHELALPLLEIAATTNNGSEASLSAGNRVSLIVGDLEAAEAWTAARVQRYGSSYAIRDLQQILHIRGQSELAWNIFDQVQPRSRDPHVWSGALIGHRMAGASVQDVAEWLNASESRRSKTITLSDPHKRVKLAQRYLMLAGTMDRRPGPELVQILTEFKFDRPPTYLRVKELDDSGPEHVITERGFVREDGLIWQHDKMVATPQDGQSAQNKDVIASRYEMLAGAMSAFLSNDFEESFKQFNETAYYYYLDEYLPYYAFSAAVMGRSNHLHDALSAREPALAKIRQQEQLGSSTLGYRFDEDLTYAVLAAFGEEHEEALGYLKNALNNRPYLDDRTVYPYYQVVDIAERLFEQTGAEIYRQFALELARRHTVILPMYAWAYFVVAKHSESHVEKVQSAASGLKLDSLSQRRTELPKSLIDEATEYLETKGPPYLNRSADDLELGT